MNAMLRVKLEEIARQMVGMELALVVMMLVFFLLVYVLQ